MMSYVIIYNWFTPLDEWQLIKRNDPAAAIAFAGSLIGFVIPLSSAIENAQTNIQCILWGIVALVVQLLAFFAVRLFLPSLSEQIRQGEISAGIVLAVVSLSVGMLIAASMTF
jgi:putative membrane protein